MIAVRKANSNEAGEGSVVAVGSIVKFVSLATSDSDKVSKSSITVLVSVS
jgi:hypothetical protein